MEKGYCTGPKNYSDMVLEYQTSDMICSVCGFALGSHKIDEVSQRRTFADEFGDVNIGCVGESNHLLNNNDLSTGKSKPSGIINDFSISSSTPQQNTRVTSRDRYLKFAFKTMAIMSDKLALAAKINERANEIYKKLEEQRYNKRKNQKAIMAACLYITCRQENQPRTIHEIHSVASGASRKEIGRAKEYILKKLDLEMGNFVHAGDFMQRFCSNLGMKNQAIKISQEAVKKLEEFDIRRSPASIAATIIYIVTQFSDEKKDIKDIVLATGVSKYTIKTSYKDLHLHLSKIIPNWYAQEEDLKNLVIS